MGTTWHVTTQAGRVEVDSKIRMGPDASYPTDVLPALTVFGLGLAMSVAPVTATALASVPGQRSGAESGANNAIARTGQLLSVAVVPPAGRVDR